MTTRRLASVAPELADLWDRASSATKRVVVAKACRIAARETGLDREMSDVRSALASLEGAETFNSGLLRRLDNSARSFDAEYLEKWDQPSSTDDKRESALACFSRARALSALVYALADEAQLHEAVYEAITAVEDTRAVAEALALELGQPST